MNHEAPQPTKNQIDEQGADSEYVRSATLANKLEDAKYATDPTVLVRRGSGELQPARLTGNKSDDGQREVSFNHNPETGLSDTKYVPEAHLTDENQQKRAAELAGKALRGAGIEAASATVSASEDDGETLPTEIPELDRESADEPEEYIPGEFAGRLYDFKRDFTQATLEATRRTKRSLDAVGELTDMLNKVEYEGADRRAFMVKARDEFDTVRKGAQEDIEDADDIRRDAGKLQEQADDHTREVLYMIASDLSSQLHVTGENADGYAARLLSTLDELEAANGGHDYTELRSDIQRLQTELSNSLGSWGSIENRLDDLTQ